MGRRGSPDGPKAESGKTCIVHVAVNVALKRKDMHCAVAVNVALVPGASKAERHALRRGGQRCPGSRGLEDEPNESM